MLGWDFDPSDQLPASEAAFSSYFNTVECPPWLGESTVAPISAIHATGPRKYLREGTVVGDLRTYDACTLLIGTGDGPATPILWGKLWIHYSVDLLVPTAPVPSRITQSFSFATGADISCTNTTVTPSFTLSGANFNNAFSLSSPSVTANVSGTYLVLVSGSYGTSATSTGGSVNTIFNQNGLQQNLTFGGFAVGIGGGEFIPFNIVTLVIANAGDTFGVQVQSNMTSSVLVKNGIDMTFVCV